MHLLLSKQVHQQQPPGTIRRRRLTLAARPALSRHPKLGWGKSRTAQQIGGNQITNELQLLVIKPGPAGPRTFNVQLSVSSQAICNLALAEKEEFLSVPAKPIDPLNVPRIGNGNRAPGGPAMPSPL